MQKIVTALTLILLIAQSSFAQTRSGAESPLIANVESRLQSSYKYGQQFAKVADSAKIAFMACLGLESFVAGALTGGAATWAQVGGAAAATASTGLVGPIWITSTGGMGAAIIPGAGYVAEGALHSFKDLPMRTQEWIAPLVERINASHGLGQAITLKLVNQNVDLLRSERMKILATTLSGRLKNELKDRMTCGYLSRKATARLAEIAVIEYEYLRAVHLSLTRGYPVHLQISPYSQGTSYDEVFAELAR